MALPSLVIYDHVQESILKLALEADRKSKAVVGWLVGLPNSVPPGAETPGGDILAPGGAEIEAEEPPSDGKATLITASLACLHFDRQQPKLPDVESEAAVLQALLPSGLQLLGVSVCGDIRPDTDLEKDFAAHVKADVALGHARHLQSLLLEPGAERPRLLVAAAGSDGTITYISGSGGAVQVAEGGPGAAAEAMWRTHMLLRCHVALSLPVFTDGTAEGRKPAVARAEAEVLRDLHRGDAVFLGELPASAAGKRPAGLILVQPADADAVAAGPAADGEGPLLLRGEADGDAALCADLARDGDWLAAASGVQIPVPGGLTLLLRKTKGGGTGEILPVAPKLLYSPAKPGIQCFSLKLAADVLVYAPRSMPLDRAAGELLLPAIGRQVAALCALALEEPLADLKLAAHHFCPPGLAFPVTALSCLTYAESETRAVDRRLDLHRRLGLRPDRPMLRAANALRFDGGDSPPGAGGASGKQLRDVHVGLPASGVAGGKQSLIDGSYEYFHYMQGHFDDSGWGCAYRSLQTIVSWFRLQNYTGLPVPTHRQIQETLVAIGDKEAAFVGSTQWVGAIELSYVLDQLLGVTCKVLTVQSGADMPTKGRELANHFQTQGTPVMIGGGVLAYTLLGVDYNELTGDCAFLVLDPHYTGGEDLKSIRSGGWVGWKKAVTEAGKDFFVRSAFYNLLLPQRPATV